MTNGTQFGNWPARVTGLGVLLLAVVGLLYNSVLLAGHFWCLQMISALASHWAQILMTPAPAALVLLGPGTLAASTLGGTGLLLAGFGFRQPGSQGPERKTPGGC